MDPLVNVIVHYTTLVNLFMSESLLAYSIGFTFYKKRHNNQLPREERGTSSSSSVVPTLSSVPLLSVYLLHTDKLSRP
jgi:hypothetical protein